MRGLTTVKTEECGSEVEKKGKGALGGDASFETVNARREGSQGKHTRRCVLGKRLGRE